MRITESGREYLHKTQQYLDKSHEKFEIAYESLSQKEQTHL